MTYAIIETRHPVASLAASYVDEVSYCHRSFDRRRARRLTVSGWEAPRRPAGVKTEPRESRRCALTAGAIRRAR